MMASTETVFDVIERHVGTSLTQRSVGKLSKLSHRQLVRLLEEIKTHYIFEYWFVDRDELPPPQPTSRVAFLSDRNGQIDSHEQWANDGEFVKKLLLYYPELSVLDPVDEILSVETSSALEQALRKIIPLKDLIKKGVVKLVPGGTAISEVTKQVRLTGLLQKTLTDDAFFHAISAYDPENYQMILDLNLNLSGLSLNSEERAVATELANPERPEGLLVWAAVVVKHAYARSKVADLGQSSMGVLLDADWRLYAALMGIAPTLKAENTESLPSWLLHLPLPDLVNLSWKDALVLRENEEQLAIWRDAMRDAHLHQVGADAKRLNGLREIMLARSAELRRRLGESTSTKNKLRDATIPSAISFIAALAFFADPIDALSKSAVTGCLSLLYALFAKRASTADQVLWRHFSVFLPPRSPTVDE